MKPPILDYFTGKDVISENYISRRPERVEFKKLLEAKHIDTALLVFVTPQELTQTYSPRYFKEGCSLICASYTIPTYIFKNKFLVAISPLGGPAAADGMMSELSFFGIKNFFACGSAGQIDEDLDATKFVVVKRAIRDEGTSYHYCKPSVYIEPDKELTEYLKTYLGRHGYKFSCQTTWTTDSFYRETPRAIAARKKQGAACVDMECASWCAVAKFRGCKFAQILYFSDLVKQDAWHWHKTKDDLKLMVTKLMLDCVSEFVDKR